MALPRATVTWECLRSPKATRSQAQRLVEQALHICEQTVGLAHRDTALAQQALAEVELALGRYEAALDHFQRALAVLEVFYLPGTAPLLRLRARAAEIADMSKTGLREALR